MAVCIFNIPLERLLHGAGPGLVVEGPQVFAVAGHGPAVGGENVRQVVGRHSGLHQLLVVRALGGVADFHPGILFHKFLKYPIDCVEGLLVRIGDNLQLTAQLSCGHLAPLGFLSVLSRAVLGLGRGRLLGLGASLASGQASRRHRGRQQSACIFCEFFHHHSSLNCTSVF